MNSVLKKKQYSTNEDWIKVVNDIEKYVSREECEIATAKTVQEIMRNTKKQKAVYAYSGGKDSIVLAELCRLASVNTGMIGLTELEYPAFTRWLKGHIPDNVEKVYTGQDMAWLLQHKDKLFPLKRDSNWQTFTHIKAQNMYCKKHNAGMIILGRRKADGNNVGIRNNIYTNALGRTIYNPLSEWTHEMVLAYIHYHKLALPPFYKWDNGYVEGTHPWFCRTNRFGRAKTWDEVYKIDKSIVKNAACLIIEAAECVERNK